MHELMHSIEITASPKAIFPLVSLPEGLQQWWAEDFTPVDGGAELGFFERKTIYRLRSLTLIAPASAAWLCETGNEWEGTRLIFSLMPKGVKTELGPWHEGWRDITAYYVVSCDRTWGALLWRLKAAAEGKKPGLMFSKGGLSSG
jgi:hypothetical protein